MSGSRTAPRELTLQAIRESRFDITEIICGGARGADGWGKAYGEVFGIPVKLFPADWKRLGKKAGALRNEEMANYAHGAIVIWDGKSKGTLDMLTRIENKEMEYELHMF